MDCRKARQIMDDLLDGDVNESQRWLLDEHVACCEACLRYYSGIRAVDQWARDLEPVSPGPGFTDAVMARVATEDAVYETSTTSIKMIVAGVLATIVTSAMLGASEVVYDWLVAATGLLRDMFGAAVADLAEAGQEGIAAITSLWSPLEQVKGYFSPAWVMLAVGGAALLVVVFDLVQARAVARKTM